MALMSLNYDVLSAIVEQTDPCSALRLSMVSRGAYDLGIPQALASVTLSRSQRQVTAFCQFLLADRSRLPYLRELTIKSTAFGVKRRIEFQRTADFSAAPELADTLERARRLQHLSIACFEDLLAREPRIGDVICALPELVEISLDNCGQLAMGVLSRLRRPLRRIKFTVLFNRKLPTFFHRLQSQGQLEALDLSNLDLSDGSQPHGEVHELPPMPSHWPVTCPVRWLRLGLTAYQYDTAIDIIRRTTPVVLSLPVETKVDAAFWTRFIAAASRVRHLELCLDEGKVDKLPWWLVRFCPLASHGHLILLSCTGPYPSLASIPIDDVNLPLHQAYAEDRCPGRPQAGRCQE
ncbi:hypothetical protein FOMPIDRAFT_1119859 [Fomitopsis schrenkii]|uniref:F-box domain-containing protein n=1 Tax=Fomitopsis schrenkii TaxID=2126942 RepID=S8FJS1_FOMSC|nr:hypothetical protein FOMPIDRAFT_1119859 [Fomitopsis schrenkii]